MNQLVLPANQMMCGDAVLFRGCGHATAFIKLGSHRLRTQSDRQSGVTIFLETSAGAQASEEMLALAVGWRARRA